MIFRTAVWKDTQLDSRLSVNNLWSNDWIVSGGERDRIADTSRCRVLPVLLGII